MRLTSLSRHENVGKHTKSKKLSIFVGACYTCLLGVTFVAFMTVLIRADTSDVFIRSGYFDEYVDGT